MPHDCHHAHNACADAVDVRVALTSHHMDAVRTLSASRLFSRRRHSIYNYSPLAHCWPYDAPALLRRARTLDTYCARAHARSAIRVPHTYFSSRDIVTVGGANDIAYFSCGAATTYRAGGWPCAFSIWRRARARGTTRAARAAAQRRARHCVAALPALLAFTIHTICCVYRRAAHLQTFGGQHARRYAAAMRISGRRRAPALSPASPAASRGAYRMRPQLQHAVRATTLGVALAT